MHMTMVTNFDRIGFPINDWIDISQPWFPQKPLYRLEAASAYFLPGIQWKSRNFPRRGSEQDPFQQGGTPFLSLSEHERGRVLQGG